MLSKDSLPDCPVQECSEQASARANSYIGKKNSKKRIEEMFAGVLVEKNKNRGNERTWEASKRKMPAENLPSQMVCRGQGKVCSPVLAPFCSSTA